MRPGLGSSRHFDSLLLQAFCYRSAAVLWSPSCCMTQSRQSFSWQMSHLTLEYFGQNKTMVQNNALWGVSDIILCFVFAKCGAVHRGQSSPFWTYLSKWECSRNLVVCSNGALQTKAVLPGSFQKSFLLVTFPNKPYLFSFFLIVLSWTFNMLPEACRDFV